MKHLYFLTILLIFFSFTVQAQRNCAAMEVLENLKAEDPALEQRMNAIERHTQAYLQSDRVQNRSVVTIPVVVHVVYFNNIENISDAQIQSQIEVLNQDFQNLNTDLNLIPNDFISSLGNAQIAFCLAQRDPDGNATSGITRTQGRRSSWGTTDRVKKTSLGGINPWDAAKYLNIWVCNIGNGVLGYAQFPGGNAATDGVVIDYRYFGTLGTATAPFNRGRTATHEVGHWLNLRHIWGDTFCGSDLVNDTPTHNSANNGCPTYPHLSTCTGTPVEMTMNYMDYSNDVCMYMFSAGQTARMQAVLAPGGFRASLLSSDGCRAPGEGEPPLTCAESTGLSATNISPTSATLNWSAVGAAAGYNVRLRVAGSEDWIAAFITGTSASAASLLANTDYEFQVQTVCEGLTSNFVSATFTTQPEGTVCADIYESNNSNRSAANLPLGVPINATIASSEDVDWFKFENTAGQRNIRVTLTNLPDDYDVRLFRGNTRVGTADNEGTTDEEIVYNNSRNPTTYYIQVYGYKGAFDTNRCYELTATISGSALRGEAGVVPSLESVELQNELVVFPNPASDEVMLDIPITTETLTQIQLFDMAGKLLHTQTEFLSKNNQLVKINIQHLPSGIYVVRAHNENYNSSQKFIINR